MNYWYPITFDIKITIGLLVVAAFAITGLIYINKTEAKNNKK